VANNPLKYVDPSGLDWVIVGGTGSEATDSQEWYDWLYANDMVLPGEYIYFIPDTDSQVLNLIGNGDIAPRYNCLVNYLNSPNVEFTNIKLIGHSEGAATVGQLMADFVNGTGNIPEHVRDVLADQLKAVFLLEAPTGIGTSIKMNNYDYNNLNGVGDKLATMNKQSADIYNSVSMVHRSSLQGWNAYDTARWYEKTANELCKWTGGVIREYIGRGIMTPILHDRIKTDALTVIKSILAK
jgi:hypothetical protein